MYQRQEDEIPAAEAPLKDRIAVVTGGARGLGRCIAQVLCEAGARVTIADLRADLAQQAAEEIAAGGGSADSHAIDLRDERQVNGLIDHVAAAHGGLDILVNNAAVDVTVPVEELSVEDWDRVMATNLRGPFLASKFAFPVMKRRGSGSIVNIASTASRRVWPNAAAYHASKWGLLGLSHALHVEGRPHGVKVTALIAGGMSTPFLLDRFPDIDTALLQDPMNVARAVKFAVTQPPETVIPEMMVLPMKETSWP